jgi:hypothetical protein
MSVLGEAITITNNRHQFIATLLDRLILVPPKPLK